MQWIQYSIIANIAMRYYNVSSFLIDMTSMIYMITYIPLIFPASYLLNKFVSNNLINDKIEDTEYRDLLCFEIIVHFL